MESPESWQDARGLIDPIAFNSVVSGDNERQTINKPQEQSV